MSRANVEIVRRFLLISNEQDLDAALSDVAAGAEHGRKRLPFHGPPRL